MPSLKDGEILQLRDCLLLRDHQLIADDIWVRNGKIINPEPLFFEEKQTAHVQIECAGAIVAPGFIDVQINGGFGVDFSSGNESIENDLNTVAKGILSHGVTSFCPTLITSNPKLYKKVLPRIKPTSGGPSGAGILGIHVEGPFINKEKRGAHPIQCILGMPNGMKDIENIYGDLENVKMITLAPELVNAQEVIKELTKRNIAVSLGHSMGSLTEGEEAVRNGARFITHLFNAMLPFHHRDPGLVGLLASECLNKNPIFYGIIVDGIHTHPAALRIAYSTHGKGLVLVTDAISAMGLEPGRYSIGNQDIEITENKAVLSGTQTLCGSTHRFCYE